MRAPSLRPFLPFALLSASCGGGDLTLPGPGDPATLTIVAGDGQQAPPGEPLGERLVVELLDGIGRPVPGTGVTFRFVSDVPQATLDPGAAPTDDQGRASAQARLGMREGEQNIEALVAVDGEDLRVRFNLTALAPVGGGGDGEGGDDGGGAGPPPPPPPPPPGGGGDDGGGGNGGGGDVDDGGGGGNGGGGDVDDGGGGDDHGGVDDDGGDDGGGGKGKGKGKGRGHDHDD